MRLGAWIASRVPLSIYPLVYSSVLVLPPATPCTRSSSPVVPLLRPLLCTLSPSCIPTFPLTLLSKSTYTTTWTATSWSFDTHGKPTAHHSTNTFTLSGRANNNAAAEPSPDPSPTHLQPRALNDDNHRSVWMFHPWSRSVVCYACYTTKPYDFTTLECRSGPAHAGECGDRPTETDDVFSTSTMTLTSTLTAATAPMSTTTSTSTSFTTLSTTLSFPSSPTAATDLERRKSWHRRVTFTHPFFPAQKLCADAEWEKRGQPETEIRLQKIGTDMDKCGKEDEVWDLSVPADVSRFVDTTVVVGQVVTDVATVTRTVLVMPVVDGRGEEGVIVHGDL